MGRCHGVMGQMGRIFPEFTKEAVLVIASTIWRFYTSSCFGLNFGRVGKNENWGMIKKGYFLFLTGASSWRFSGLGLLPCRRSMKLFMSNSEGASLHFFMSSLFMTFSSWCGLRDRRAESTRLWSSSGSFSVSEDSWTKLTYAARVLPRPSSKSWRRHLPYNSQT